MLNLKKNWHYLFYFLLSLLYIFFLLTPIKLTSVDLGRHITNGRELLAGRSQVLYQNHYSFTLPEQKFVNHHWLFGVLTFFLEQTVGFEGLHIFNIVVLISSLWIFLKLVEKNSSPTITSLLGIFAIIFLSIRTEIRPESLGLLFIANTLWQINNIIVRRKISIIQIALICTQQFLWVNIHISFIFGIFLIALFWGCSVFLSSPKLTRTINRKLGLTIIFLVMLSLLNPNFFQGLIAPLSIFSNYGYSVVENQTLLYLWEVIGHQGLVIFLLFLLMISPSFIYSWKITSWFERVLAITGVALGYSALRNAPIFVMFAFPVFAKTFYFFIESISRHLTLKISSALKTVGLTQIYFLTILLAMSGNLLGSFSIHNRGIGTVANEEKGAKYILEHNLPQPIYNNYDIGSYLIYHLYPKYRTFTDNRPEAYSSDFFQDTYIPMQQNPIVWKEMVDQYQIKTVILGVQDITPWAKQFLLSINKNENWKKVFSDQFIEIWVETNS